MKVLIIEDEYRAAQKLTRLLKKVDNTIEILEIIESVENSTNWLLSNPSPDLIFMDIQLEDGISFEIFETIELKTPVIFTTAFDEYSLKAFKVNSVDYLLKPIEFEDLQNALNKFRTVHQKNINFDKIELMLDTLKQKNKERFLIKIGEHYRSIQITDINCFFIKERCNFIHTDKGKVYALDYSLDRIEEMISPEMFFRINRNFIINFYAIRDIVAFSSSRLKLSLDNWQDKEEIVVSRERVSDFKKWIDR